jgi:hypothetical protein
MARAVSFRTESRQAPPPDRRNTATAAIAPEGCSRWRYLCGTKQVPLRVYRVRPPASAGCRLRHQIRKSWTHWNTRIFRLLFHGRQEGEVGELSADPAPSVLLDRSAAENALEIVVAFATAEDETAAAKSDLIKAMDGALDTETCKPAAQ